MLNNAIILAAGRGGRLKPFTNDTPKALLSLEDDYKLIDIIFQSLKKNLVGNVSIVVGYMYNSIVQYVSAKYSFPDFSICYILNRDYDKTNTAYSLLLTCPALQNGGLIINGDTLISPSSLEKLSKFNGTCVGISHRNVDDEAVKVVYEPNNKVSAIGKKVKGIAEYVGVAKIEPTFGSLMCKQLNYLFSFNKELLKSLYYDDVINHLLCYHPVYAVDLTDEIVMDIDTMEDLNYAKRLLSNYKRMFK